MEDNVDPPEFLSTHPSHETRQEHLAKLIPDALLMRSGCGCPKLGPNDPNLSLQKFVLAMKRQIESERKEDKKARVIAFR